MKRDKRKPGIPFEQPKASPKAPPKREFDRRHLLVGAVILLALFTYSNSFRAPFLMDNADILNDTRVHQATSENVDRIFHGSYHQASLSGLYRPLTLVSYMYNYAVRGDRDNPEGWHWFNFELHAVNIVLVYLLGLLLFEDIAAALAFSALWGLHPVLTEGVTNIVGRADALAAFGTLGAVVGYAHSVRRSGTARALLLAGTAIATAVGAFSKESGVVALAAVILYDLVFEWGGPWARRIPGLLAVAIPAAGFLLVRARAMAGIAIAPFPFLDNPIAGATFVEGRMTAFRVIAKCLGLLVWPAKLSPDYSYNEIPIGGGVGAAVGLALCVALGAAALWFWKSRKPLAFSILFFFVTLAPVSNVFLVIGSIMGERFLYLPAVGFAAAITYGLRRLWLARPQQRKIIAAAVGVVLVAFAARAHARNEDWSDEHRFWEAAVRTAPGSFKPHISMAGLMPRDTQEGWDRALAEVKQALAIIENQPDERNSPFPYRNAGILYRAYGEFLAPKNAASSKYAYQASLDVLKRSERIERAQDEINQKLNAARGLPKTTYLPSAIYRELGITYLRLEDLPNAVRALEFGHNLESEPDLLENLAVAYGLSGDLARSAQVLVEELEVDGKRSYLAEKLVGIYKQMDPNGCAVKREGGAETLDITCPRVHQDICSAARNVVQNYTRRQQIPEADAIRRVATADLGCPAASLQ